MFTQFKRLWAFACLALMFLTPKTLLAEADQAAICAFTRDGYYHHLWLNDLSTEETISMLTVYTGDQGELQFEIEENNVTDIVAITSVGGDFLAQMKAQGAENSSVFVRLTATNGSVFFSQARDPIPPIDSGLGRYGFDLTGSNRILFALLANDQISRFEIIGYDFDAQAVVLEESFMEPTFSFNSMVQASQAAEPILREIYSAGDCTPFSDSVYVSSTLLGAGLSSR